MTDRGKNSGRDSTDLSLDQERRKTDDELTHRRAHLEEDSDAVVARARARADEIVRSSREAADTKTPPTPTDRARLGVEREREDTVLADERALADRQLESERTNRQQLIANLLLAEREATDTNLRSERSIADDAISARDDFLAMVSHDLRTLVHGIALNAALVVQDAPPDSAAGGRIIRRADSIQRFTTRMARLVGDLVDVASIEAGRLKFAVQKLDATRLLRETLDTFQPVAAAHGIMLGATMADNALLAKFDHDRIGQVLGNLISNAIKFTDPKGRIDITVEPNGAEVRFTVRDTGRGIAPEALGAIFDRCWQAPEPGRRGLGLGLYISKCIVEAHGGRIWAESQLGHGSTFCFTLPRASA
ncbi:MAG TPA: HAMP domain-containing sensor histidine kinase [Kofleriaceae bacterium]|nr:HAMP domain-containing sensor histidine kinase [Kofleriaceae bacterium]